MMQSSPTCLRENPRTRALLQESARSDLAWRSEARSWLGAVAGTTGVAFRLSAEDGVVRPSDCRYCCSLRRVMAKAEKPHTVGCVGVHQLLQRAARDSGVPVLRTCRSGLHVYAVSVSVSFGGTGVIECGPFRRTEFSVETMMSRWSHLGLSALDQAELAESCGELPVLDDERLKAMGEFLVCLARGIPAAADAATPPVSAGEPMAVVAARRFIVEQVSAEHLTLGQVARHVGLSEDYFSKLFQRTIGLTFTDYLNRIRVTRVCHLLITTPAGIAELALACGFGSVPHFNRIFRRYTGFSPTDYRRHGKDKRLSMGMPKKGARRMP